MKTIAEAIESFEATNQKLSTLEQRLAAERWVQPPASGGWTPLQNIEHLNLITNEFMSRFEKASAQLQPAQSSVMKMEAIGRLLSLALNSKGPFIKMKSPPRFVPAGRSEHTAVISEFHQNQQRLTNFLRASANKSLDAVKIVSPFDERFRYSIFSALSILSAEQERHFRQIERSI
jgi:hypothetical protein